MGLLTPDSPLANMRSPAFPPRRPSALLRYLIPALGLVFCFYYLTQSPATELPRSGLSDPRPDPRPNAELTSASPLPESSATDSWSNPEEDAKLAQRPTDIVDSHPTPTPLRATPTAAGGKAAAATHSSHPIDVLIGVAQKEFDDKLSREAHSLNDAASAYRARRGRHPPPGFDKWYEFAKERNAVLVEEFWDQIHHDLEPFWAIPAKQITKEAWDYEMTIKVRNNNATAASEWFWTQIWLNMTKTIEHLLPDMDIALNPMDEPRLVAPWEVVNDYMAEAARTRKMADPSEVISEFQSLAQPGEGEDRGEKTRDKNWEETRPFWTVARRGCPPDSLARKGEIMHNFNHTPFISPALSGPHTYRGFVSNYTLSTQFCHQPDIQGLNGIFVNPLSVSSTKTLFPMFGGSKLAVNNEILLPAPMYWSEEERFTGGDEHGGPWEKKKDEVVWRGVATGGNNNKDNWKAFQRHRFVAMNNATKLQRAEDWTELPNNFALPATSYHVRAQEEGRLGQWVGQWANVSFIDLMCGETACNHTKPYFNISDAGVSMKEQFDYKYLPDIDGNSFSGRYLGFMRSTSLPIKSTLFREWHDSRLVAWKHFVPMDNRYGDWYGIMEYFLGYGDGGEVPGHDAAAEKIASDGKAWAEKVLRKEDMQIYVLRLLLEYARICDERREKMGWVGDLAKNSASLASTSSEDATRR